jgi:VanZ family protein
MGQLWRAGFWCCALAVLYLSLTPLREPVGPQGLDKVHHVVAFGTMALLAALAWPAHLPTSLAGLLAYGWTIELLQSFTDTRTADAEDVLADAVGLLVAWAIVQGVERWRGARLRRT